MQRLRSTRSNAVSHKLVSCTSNDSCARIGLGHMHAHSVRPRSRSQTPRKSNLQKDDEEERCTSFEECEKVHSGPR